MSAIDRLTRASSLSGSDLVALFSASLGDDAAATLSTLVTYLQAQLTADTALMTQYSAPAATGFSVTVAPAASGGSVWLLLTPAAGYAAGTVVLPASPVDGQHVQVSCTQAVTALTVNGNGSTVNGAPTTLAANGFFTLRFDGVFGAWYRVS